MNSKGPAGPGATLVVVAVVLTLLLSSCAHVQRADHYISSVESRTWIAHGTGAAAAVTIADVAFDKPWWGYGIYMGLQIGWEANEYLTRKKYGIARSKPIYTFMDLLTPAVTGWIVAKLLDDESEDRQEEP